MVGWKGPDLLHGPQFPLHLRWQIRILQIAAEGAERMMEFILQPVIEALHCILFHREDLATDLLQLGASRLR